jgi:tetrahydromethanopterin S-methyltransferase subunit G
MLENDEPTKTDLQQLEARIDARFQAVNARFISIDGRFAALDDRLDGIDQQVQVMERFGARFHSIDNRLDATRAQVEHVQQQLSTQIDQGRHDLGRIVLLGLLGTIVSTTGLCLGTLVLVL